MPGHPLRIELTYGGTVRAVEIPHAALDLLMPNIPEAERIPKLETYLQSLAAVQSLGNWIKVESTNRQNQTVRTMNDLCKRLQATTASESDKQSQITASGTDYVGMESEYQLTTGDGEPLYSLIQSLKAELDAAPFFQQFMSRVG